MGDSVKCQICGNKATVHLTQIISNEIHKVDLCEDCAKQQGVTGPEGFSLGDLLSQAQGSASPITENAGVCGTCGLTAKDFKKTGRFGCPDCYNSFGGILQPMIENMHKGSHHMGKIPRKSLERVSIQRRVDELERDLRAAVKEERYEDAARFRDEITSLKRTLMPSETA